MSRRTRLRVLRIKAGLILLAFLSPIRSVAQTADLDVILGKIDLKADTVGAIFHWVITEMEYDPQQLLLLNEND